MNINLTNADSVESFKKLLYNQVESDLFDNLKISKDTCNPSDFKDQISKEVDFLLNSEDYKEIVDFINKKNQRTKIQFTGQIFCVDELTQIEMIMVNNLVEKTIISNPEVNDDYVLGYKDEVEDIKVRFITRESVDPISKEHSLPVSEILINYLAYIGE